MGNQKIKGGPQRNVPCKAAVGAADKKRNGEENGKRWFLKGMRDGFPIGMGYFAVAFTLGIASKKAGLTALQASLMSATMLASAGQFAGIGMIAAGAGYVELAVTELVVNLR